MIRIIMLLILIPVCCFGSEKKISDFISDGCTLFPDSSQILETDWCECCFEHDIAYWQGGTEEERLKADKALLDCVLKKTGSEKIAKVIYSGVRFGGSPYFYNWYRWGYGWGYHRKYKKISKDEKKQVEMKLKEYFSSNREYPCK